MYKFLQRKEISSHFQACQNLSLVQLIIYNFIILGTILVQTMLDRGSDTSEVCQRVTFDFVERHNIFDLAIDNEPKPKPSPKIFFSVSALLDVVQIYLEIMMAIN